MWRDHATRFPAAVRAAPTGSPVDPGGGARGCAGSAAQPRRSSSTASTRRFSSAGVGQPELREHARDVLLGAAHADAELLGDRRVRQSLADQLERLALALGEGLERTAVVLRQQPCHDLGVERRAAGGDPAQRVHELVGIGHAVLEQVAEPLRVLGEHARGHAGLDVLREDHDRRAGAPRADLVRRTQSFVGVRRRHPDVDDRDLRERARRPRSAAPRASPACAAHLDPGLLEQRHDPLADEQVVVRDHDPHGSSAVIVVPAPGGLVT